MTSFTSSGIIYSPPCIRTPPTPCVPPAPPSLLPCRARVVCACNYTAPVMGCVRKAVKITQGQKQSVCKHSSLARSF